MRLPWRRSELSHPAYDKACARLPRLDVAGLYDYVDDYVGRFGREVHRHRQSPSEGNLGEARAHVMVLLALVDELDKRG